MSVFHKQIAFVVCVMFALLWLPLRSQAAPQTAPQAATCSYTVQPGDTLGAIARRHNTTVAAIAAASNVANWNLIYVGQVLTIPNCNTAAAATPTTPTPAPQPVAVTEDTTTFTEDDLTFTALRYLPNPPADLSADLAKRVDGATVQLIVLTPGRVEFGTGTVIGSDGHTILTAYHVVGDTEAGEPHAQMAILVGPYKGYTLRARFVRGLPESDLAILRVERRSDFGGFAFLPLADSDAATLGSQVHIYSYPARREGGLARSAGSLIGVGVDAKTHVRRVFFTEALASPGSSGGVAVNGSGEVVGIVSGGFRLNRGIDRDRLPTIRQITTVIPINHLQPLRAALNLN